MAAPSSLRQVGRDPVPISELLLSLDSPELQEAEQVRAAINQQLSSDRGGAVLSSLVDFYLDSSSSQALQLLANVREPHHKPLLDKLNDVLSRPAVRLAAVTLLGHLVRKQPPWVHHISRSPLLTALLRCLKTDGDVVVLVTGVLVLITLLPMIPQAGRTHIYDFFDVFGRLASWSLKNPGQVPLVQLLHLQAAVYSLFHRLYGMFPCNFISYLRLHYSMKENLDTFQEVVKPMLDQVRVHPELVTGTQDYELDPSRWKSFEVHDIMMECARVSLDPLESSCDDLLPPPPRTPPCSAKPGSSSCPLASPGNGSFLLQVDDVTWSPSNECGLSTPPPAISPAHPLGRAASVSGERAAPVSSAHPLRRTASTSGERSAPPLHLSVPGTPPADPGRDGAPPPDGGVPAMCFHSEALLGKGPVRGGEEGEGRRAAAPVAPPPPSPPPPSSSHGPPPPLSLPPLLHVPEGDGPPPPYDPLFDLALPRAAMLFLGRRTQEALQRAGGSLAEGGDGGEEDPPALSPLETLDQLIVCGHHVHHLLSRRDSVVAGGAEPGHAGGVEEVQVLSSQLQLLHAQLQYERFKRQQHAVRNRRLLRRVVNAAALEEHTVAMRGQLGVQDEEIRSLRSSLEAEQQRHAVLQADSSALTTHLHTHIQTLLQQQQQQLLHNQRLESELQESQSRLRDLEAELQRANNKAYNAEHQLGQLSLKLSSSEQLQQQIFFLTQQLVLLRGNNTFLMEQLEEAGAGAAAEASLLQGIVGKEFYQLKEAEMQQRQKLEAANQRAADLEGQLALRDQLLLDQKKLLDDAKTQSRAELSACESRYVSLRLVTQKLQTEMLQLYSQVPTEPGGGGERRGLAAGRPLDVTRPHGGSSALPVAPGPPGPRPSSHSMLNGSLEPAASSSPLDSPLTVGSFLEQRARRLFRPTGSEAEPEGAESEGEESEVELEAESPPLGQEAEEALLLAGSPPDRLPGRAPSPSEAPDLTFAVRRRRRELSIMDYDETAPEY